MSDIIIAAENLSKQYRLGQVGRKALSHDINRWWYRIRGKENPYLKIGQENGISKNGSGEYVWALQDINFEVRKGEVLGIIGKNGAGKSTLLKILSKVTAPTTGIIKTKGRIASLLEVGTGFHPELTGRQNIFLNGAILGMTKNEIEKKFDEIVDFSGVELYIDTPVKRYSSGMYVRLAFAVAAHLEPEILIVDEVLAVGDTEFQKKCLGRMKDVSEKEGRTVLFVSHNMAAITSLSSHSICLMQGKIAMNSNTTDVVKIYLEETKANKGVFEQLGSPDRPSVIKVEVITSETQGIHKHGEPLEIFIDIHMPYYIESIGVSVQIFNEKEIPVIFTYLFDFEKPILRKTGINKVRCVLNNCRLYEGSYYLCVHLAESKGKTHFETIDKICRFDIQMLGKTIEWGWRKDICMYMEDFSWESI